MLSVRTCPQCGYRYRLIEYLNVLLRFRDRYFACNSCRVPLRFSYGRRRAVALVAMAPLTVAPLLSDFFSRFFQITWWAGYLVFVALFFAWSLLVYSQDRFVLSE